MSLWSECRAVVLGCSVLLAVAGCKGDAAAPESLQGVIELDERLVSFQLAGRVVEVKVARGDRIAAGAAVARLDDALDRPMRDLRAADLATAKAQLRLLKAGSRREDIAQVRAQLAAAKESERIAEGALKRQQNLVVAGAATPARTDEFEGQLVAARGQRQTLEERLAELVKGARSQELDAALSRVEAAEAALAAMDARLAQYALAAPIDGEVLDVHVDPGEVVTAGTPVITLGDTTHPYIDIFVAEGRMNGVHLGQAAMLEVDGSQASWTGTIEHIARQTEFTPRYLFSERERPNLVIRVRVRIADPERRLHAGVPAQVRLAGGAGATASVPAAAGAARVGERP